MGGAVSARSLAHEERAPTAVYAQQRSLTRGTLIEGGQEARRSKTETLLISLSPVNDV